MNIVMNIKNLIIIGSSVFCIGLGLVSAGLAEDGDSRFESQNYKMISDIKNRVSGLLEENKKLISQNEILKEQQKALRLVFEERRKELEQLIEETGAFWLQGDSASFDDAMNGNFRALEKDKALKESRTGHLNSELMDFNERQRLWKLYLADLEYQKRDLMLELKLKEASAKENNRDHGAEIQALRQEVMINREKEQRILSEIERLQGENGDFAKQAEQIQRENAELQEKITILERRADIKYKENGLLKDKILYTSKLKESPVMDSLRERKELSAEVVQLQKEYETLNSEVNSSMAQLDLKRQLVNNVMSKHKENQDLKTKITEIRDELGLTP